MDLHPFIAGLFCRLDRRPSPKIESTRELGRYGEKVAERFLRRHNYRVLARNWKSNRWEIDLICRQRNELVFIEVKTRRDARFAEPADNVNATKRQKITYAAAAYLKQLRHPGVHARFDVVEVMVETGTPPVCRLIANAYENESLYI
jgi:putative endonuclease